MHRIFQMEKVISSFQYEPLIFTLEPETLDEEEKRGNANGVGPLGIRTEEGELAKFKGRKDNP
jgi:hypothetical protein